MKKISISIITALIGLHVFAGDVISLTNNMTFVGKVLKIKECTVVFKAGGGKYEIPADDIFMIAFENPDNKVYADYIKLDDSNPKKCMKAQLDAESFHGKKIVHFALGFLFGPFAMLGTAISNPTPGKGSQTLLMSKNEDLFNDPVYLKCYKKKAKGQLIGMEAMGWAAWIVLLIAL